MIAVVFLAALPLGLLAFGLAAMRWGVDSREDSRDPRRSQYPVGLD